MQLDSLINRMFVKIQTDGWHTVHFNAHNLSSGQYLYRLQAANVVLTGKMALVK